MKLLCQTKISVHLNRRVNLAVCRLSLSLYYMTEVQEVARVAAVTIKSSSNRARPCNRYKRYACNVGFHV